jgi:hypothetical protein
VSHLGDPTVPVWAPGDVVEPPPELADAASLQEEVRAPAAERARVPIDRMVAIA